VPVALLLVAGVLSLAYARKAANDRSAFVRWRPQIHALVRGENVYTGKDASDERDIEADPDTGYPNPPLLAIVLYPLAALPALPGAMAWFFIKAVMIWWVLYWCINLATGPGRPLPLLAAGLVLLVVARPMAGDLQHGNVNILIIFLVAAGLWCFAHRRDIPAGLLFALATAFKVTPALFLVYFAWKRQWKLLAAAAAGLALFLLILPGLVLGMRRNIELLDSWRTAMIMPYLTRNHVETRQHNQSIPGVVHRLLTDSGGIQLKDQSIRRVNLASLDTRTAQWIVKGITLLILAWLGWACRTPTADRRDWRLACEYGLVALAMLFISERTWKHHYVSMTPAVAAVIAHWSLRETSPRARRLLLAAVVAALLLMATTSTETGAWLAPNKLGHKYAQAYGGFLLAGLVLFAATSWILVRNRHAHPAALPAGHDASAPPVVTMNDDPTTASIRDRRLLILGVLMVTILGGFLGSWMNRGNPSPATTTRRRRPRKRRRPPAQ
jgi:hypothetical protein